MRRFRLFIALLGLTGLFGLSACSRSDSVEPADLIFTGGAIFTADTDMPEASAVAVRADRIIYVGSSKGAEALVGERTRKVDIDDGLLTRSHGFTYPCIHGFVYRRWREPQPRRYA